MRGLYKVREAPGAATAQVHLLGSGALLREAIAAQTLLHNRGIAADVWSATSYSELYRDAVECDRWNRAHPSQEPRRPYLQRALAGADGVFVAVSDYIEGNARHDRILVAGSVDRAGYGRFWIEREPGSLARAFRGRRGTHRAGSGRRSRASCPMSIAPVQWRIVAICALILLIDGYDILAMAMIVPSLAGEWQLAPSAFAPALSACIAGVAIGSALAGKSGDRFGRRRTLLAFLAGGAACHRIDCRCRLDRGVGRSAPAHGRRPGWNDPAGARAECRATAHWGALDATDGRDSRNTSGQCARESAGAIPDRHLELARRVRRRRDCAGDRTRAGVCAAARVARVADRKARARNAVSAVRRRTSHRDPTALARIPGEPVHSAAARELAADTAHRRGFESRPCALCDDGLFHRWNAQRTAARLAERSISAAARCFSRPIRWRRSRSQRCLLPRAARSRCSRSRCLRARAFRDRRSC